MKKIILLVLVLGIVGFFTLNFAYKQKNHFNIEPLVFNEVFANKQLIFDDFIVYIPHAKKIKIYWKDQQNQPYTYFGRLLNTTGQSIDFMTNGGIYSNTYTPEGLYIENGKVISELNLNSAEGNFYLKPNGVFYLENERPVIVESTAFQYSTNIRYAVQSGPLLINNGQLNPNINQASQSLKIRSAVGLSQNNHLFFLMSRRAMNFYDFAKYAQDYLDSKELLFLDGTISQMYFAADNSMSEQKYPFVTIITAEE